MFISTEFKQGRIFQFLFLYDVDYKILILVFLFVFLFLQIAIEMTISAVDKVTYSLLTEEQKKKVLVAGFIGIMFVITLKQ